MLAVKILQMAPVYEIKSLNLAWLDYILALMYAKIFCSFSINVLENAEWCRFLAHPVDHSKCDDSIGHIYLLVVC